MSVTIVKSEKEETPESASVERDLGRVENELIHVSDEVAEVAQQVETIEEKLEWTAQTQGMIFNRLEQLESRTELIPQIAETVEILKLQAMQEIEDEVDLESQTETELENLEVVEIDIPTETPIANPKLDETQKTWNPFKILMFGNR